MTHHLLMIGTSELLLIAALVLLLFGGKKLPEMMKGLGQGVRSFKDGMREVTEDERDVSAKPADKSENSECSENSEHSENSDKPQPADGE